MEPWDVTMSDLLNGRALLDSFRGVIFVGGFSYADTLDSAKGWSGETKERGPCCLRWLPQHFKVELCCSFSMLQIHFNN
jgi:hypothetical protein